MIFLSELPIRKLLTLGVSFFISLSLSAAQLGSEADPIGADGLRTVEVNAFLTQLQQAVQKNKPAAVAQLVDFPLQVSRNGKPRILQRIAFLSNYSRWITPKIRSLILSQKPTELMRNSKGVMLGQGEIWFSGVCQDEACQKLSIKVIALNPDASNK
jgi:hypothetical protein